MTGSDLFPNASAWVKAYTALSALVCSNSAYPLHSQGLFWPKIFVREKKIKLVKFSEKFSNLMRFFFSLGQN